MLQDELDPRSWDEYFGHERVVRLAKAALASNRLPKSILVSGPTGVGKGALVRLFLRALRCERRRPGEVQACGECPVCRSDPRRADPAVEDLMWVQSGSGESLNRQVAEAIEFARTPPRYNLDDHRRVKVVVIDEVDVLSYPQIVSLYYESEIPQPHGRTLFIFVTMNEAKLAEQQFRALADRGQHWRLGRLSEYRIDLYLRSRFPQLSAESRQLVASHCGGSIRGALQILERVRTLDPYFTDLSVAAEVGAATPATRAHLWQLVQSPHSRMADITAFLRQLDGEVDERVLLGQLVRDVEAAIESAPNPEQILFLDRARAVQTGLMPLSTLLAMAKGAALVNPAQLQADPDPFALLEES